MTHYIAIVHKDPDSDYGISFPDFPGCVTADKTIDKAKDMAIEALSGHMKTMAEFGEAIPRPSSIESVIANDDYADAVAFLVVPAPEIKPRTARVNITVPENTLMEIDAMAGKLGMSRSSFLIRAAQKVIQSEVRI